MTAQDLAREWIAADPDERMRALLAATLAEAEAGSVEAQAELDDAFAGTLEFGTAGLRGRVGPGSNRMNVVVVARAAAGLARYLNERGGGAVVVGHDARHDSDLFARATAQILSGAGISVMMLPAHLPTPVLAFAVRHLGCAAGVMVTASHNPPADNGYKVYLGDGSQIVSPVDREISAHIADVTALGPVADLPHGEEWITLGDEVVQAYVDKAAALVEDGPPLHIRLAYTAMHGVGGEVFLRVLEQAGFPEPVVVAEQFAPDADFPTVSFPNPEEPGAMDLALAAAQESGCDLVIAHDPDADRCAVGVPTDDGWRMLSGDEVGYLLGWWIAAGNRRLGRRGVFAQSIVSGSMLARIAADAHLDYEQTLTGFKWIARVPGPRVRLRGGARLLRRSQRRARQGRHLGGAHGRRDGGPAEGLERQPAAGARRPRRRVRGARHPTGLGARERPRPHPRGDVGVAGASADHRRGHGGRVLRGSRAGCPRPSPHRRPAHRARLGCPHHRAAERHRAEGEVLPPECRAGDRRRPRIGPGAGGGRARSHQCRRVTVARVGG